MSAFKKWLELETTQGPLVELNQVTLHGLFYVRFLLWQRVNPQIPLEAYIESEVQPTSSDLLLIEAAFKHPRFNPFETSMTVDCLIRQHAMNKFLKR